MSLPPYPNYKDSGVEWLGQVPEHWEVCALKRIVSMQSGESITGESIEETGEYQVFGGNGLRGYTSAFTHDGKFVLIGRQGALCGNINYASGKFWASEHAVVATPIKQVNTVWLGEILRAMNLNQYSVAAAQPGLSVDLIGCIGIGLPPLPEQTQIAAFLDRETAKIDGLVAEQRRLMELLREKRQAVISHAVTRGLNPHAPMKPSGMAWLGEVPAHWEVIAAKRVSNVFVPQRNKPELNTDQDGVAWVTMERMNSEEVQVTDLWVSDAAARDAGSRVLKAGAVIASCVGTFGIAAVNRTDVIINQQLQAYITSERMNTKFFRHCVVSSACYFEMIGTAATIAYVNQLGFENMPLAVPPHEEQEAIVEHIARETIKLDTLTAEAQRAIALLQERRSALISAAVTGQIDVRAPLALARRIDVPDAVAA